jgi:putative ABC transport system permease protein
MREAWGDLWLALPAWGQDALIAAALLAVPVLLGLALRRGHRPDPLVGALLLAHRWTNAAFVLLIAVSVGLGVGLLAQERGLRAGTAQAADKFDLIVSAPGSELTVMLAAVYLQPTDMPLLDGPTYARIAGHERVELAAPLAFGDSWEGAPVVGTTQAFLDHLTGGAYEGRGWATPFEAVAGAATSLGIGDAFVPLHGHGAMAQDLHATELTVTGRMAPTGTPWDRAILVPVESVWITHGLASGHPPGSDRLGPPFDPAYFPGTPAVLIHATDLGALYGLQALFNDEMRTMAFFPGAVLAGLYRVMGDVREAMSALALATQGLVAASVLLGLALLVRLFQRRIAMLRALGAPARFVLGVVWGYATALLATGTVLGLGVGLAAAAVLGRIVTARTDIAIPATLGWPELHLALAFLAATSLASLIPAALALRRPVAPALRA